MKSMLVIQHVEHEGLGIIDDLLVKRGLKPDFVKTFRKDSVPKTIDGYSALIVMGGPMGVYEADIYPFISDEIFLIKDGLRKNIPMLGICLGAQLIVKALGSDVYKGKKKEIGWYKISLTNDGKMDELFNGLPDEFTVFQWHGDTFDIPDGCRCLASSDLFPNQIIKAGKNVYSLQFHLEVTGDMVKEWIDVNDEELKSVKDYIDAGKILKEAPAFIKRLNEHGEVIFNRFLNLIDK
ncbi:MAG TPA: GMP synthase [Deltaproteobacteria bacterium]|nr:GMP synthase [Deltaproteobacteria bacterium]